MNLRAELNNGLRAVKRFFAPLTQVDRSNFNFIFSPSLNLPPVISGEMIIDKIGSGGYPVVNFLVPSFSDPDGSIAKVRWDFGDGTEVEFLAGEFNANAYVSHVYEVGGHYTAKIEVEDNLGAITSLSKYIETQEDTQPSIKAAATVGSGNNVTFHLTGSDPETAVYFTAEACGTYWNTPMFTCSFATNGTYPFRATVSDETGTRRSISTEIVRSGPGIYTFKPFAVIKASSLVGSAPFTVVLDGSDSSRFITASPNNGITSYLWKLDDWERVGNIQTTNKFTHTFERPGTYNISLIVKDINGLESTAYQTIHVLGQGNLEPQLMASYNSPLQVRFEGSNTLLNATSEDHMFFWDFGDGVKEIGRFKTHSYPSAGTYTVKLKIFDLLGETHELQKTITVGSSYDNPVAIGNISTYEPTLHQLISIDSSASLDPANGQPLEHIWILNDGTIIEDDSFLHRIEKKGQNLLDLWVTNSRGLSTRQLIQFATRDEFSDLKARMIYSPKIGYAPLTFTVDGSTSGSSESRIVSSYLKIGDRNYPTGSPITLSTVGTHYMSYIVKDAAGNQSIAFGNVTVLAPGTIPGTNAAPVALINADLDGSVARKYHFHCNSSYDTDGSIAHCSWKINGKPFVDERYFSTLFSEDRLYTVELTVTDNWGRETIVQRQFDFSTESVPMITFDFFPRHAGVGENVTFLADRAHVPGKQIVSYSWDFGDGASGGGKKTTHSYGSMGLYNVVLTLTADDSSTYQVTKVVSVAPVSGSFNLELIAQTVDGLGTVKQNEVFTGFGAPETVVFSANADIFSSKSLKEVTWDFGDAQTGRGTVIEHTYFQPGTYTVSATAVDMNNVSSTKTLQISVADNTNCPVKNNRETCLKASNSNTNVVSGAPLNMLLSQSNGLAFSLNPADYTQGWIRLRFLDGSGKVLDLSSFATVSGSNILLTANSLFPKLRNDIPYEIEASTKFEDGSIFNGKFPELYTFVSNMNVTNTPLVSLSFVNPSALFRRDAAPASSVSFQGIPNGKSALVMTSSTWINTVMFGGVLTSYAVPNVAMTWPTAKSLEMQKGNFKNSNVFLKEKSHKNNSWTQSLCGEPSPFKTASKRLLGEGQSPIWSFSSAEPTAQTNFRMIPEHMPRSLRLSCGIRSNGLLYAQNKWKYKDGPARCWNDPGPDLYWNRYLSSLTHEDDAVVVMYEIRDQFVATTPQDYKRGFFATSSSNIMKKNGLRLEDLTARVGLPTNDEQDWVQRIDYEIPVPTQFKRPEIRFLLASQHDTNPETFYSVQCDVINSDVRPKLLSLTSDQNVDEVHSASYNGLVSLSKRFNLFPVQYNPNASSPRYDKPEIDLARYQANIQTKGREDIEWQSMEVSFTYGKKTVTKIYDFDGAGAISEDSLFTNSFEIDTEDLHNEFSWIKGISDVELRFTPLGKVVSDHDYRGGSLTKRFTALFNVERVRQLHPTICPQFGPVTKISQFATNELVSLLHDLTADSMTWTCSDMSVPFGGRFEITSSWKYSDKSHGTSAEIYGFMQNPNQAPSYTGAVRGQDVLNYLSFSSSIDAIVAMTDEYVGGVPTEKKKLFDYCRPAVGQPIPPCNPGMPFTALNKYMAATVCLTKTTTTFTPPGCPALDISGHYRFVSWVEMNQNTLMGLVYKRSFVYQMSDGFLDPATSFIETKWQQDAITKGIWPDGMALLRTSGPTTLIPQNNSCSANPDSCSRLLPIFTDEATHFNTNYLSLGWR